MADYFKSSLKAAEIEAALLSAKDLNKTPGMIKGDGRGGVSTAIAGSDYGYPLLQGNGAPTAMTSGSAGQHYFDLAAKSAPYEYICVGLGTFGYMWEIIGESGGGFRILAYYNNYEDLLAAVPYPADGDAYGVGEAAPFDIYVFDGATKAWKNNGPLQGEPGEGLIPHGAKGQVLRKASAADYDTEWANIALQGDDSPTEFTAADYIGQLYTTGSALFVCIGSALDENGGTIYNWRPVMTGTSTAVFSATVPAAGWTDMGGYYAQTVAVEGLPGNGVKYDIDLDRQSELTAEQRTELKDAWGGLLLAQADAGAVYLEIDSAPALDIPIKVGVSF